MVKCPNEDERGHKTKCPRSSFFFSFFFFFGCSFYENGRHAMH